MDLSALGKWIVAIGLGVTALGVILWLAGKSEVPFGSRPGDIRIDRPGFSFRFPLVTCIVVSIVLTLIVQIIGWFLRR
ncbi:MAG: DUF2905 domain-containing protein [Thermodesulfobacteriota bacterium]